MHVSKVNLHELATSDLQQKFNTEWKRVSDILIRVYPLSNDSWKMMLEELLALHDELERRKASIKV